MSSCAKEEPIKKGPVNLLCDHVNINITNNLSEDITDFAVEQVSIGKLEAGETYNNLCLEVIMTDSGVYPYLSLSGIYEGQDVGGMIAVCGMGMVSTESGTFDVVVNEVADSFFYYTAD